MIRKIGPYIVAATLSVGFIDAQSPARAAAPPKIDVSNATIVCDTVIGTLGLKPAFLVGGTGTSGAMTLKGTLGACTVTDAPSPVTILKGTFSGKLVTSVNDCVAVFEGATTTGTITIKWKADGTTPIQQTSTVVTIGSLTGQVFTAPWDGLYGQLTLNPSGETGAFTGGDNGAGATITGVGSQEVQSLFNSCGTTPGLKLINIGLGRFGS
jgi:hypothetical protein